MTPPEALRIADHLRATLDAEALAAVTARIAAADDRARGLSRARRFEEKIPARSSRRTGAARCTRSGRWCARGGPRSTPARASGISRPRKKGPSAPIYGLGYELATAILAGLVQACADAGLDGSLLELIAALRVTLTRPTAAERWRKRLPVFALARDEETARRLAGG